MPREFTDEMTKAWRVKGLVQGPRARLWEPDLNPSLVDFGA